MNNRRLLELDGLRGLAALAVVFYHFFYRYHEIYGHTFAFSDLFRLGHYGVQLFFMISGFVIYWTLQRSENPLDFIWSRFSRLYPVYWACVILTFIAISLFSLAGRERSLMELLFNLLMFQEYLGIPHIDGVYWTLSLELAFYFWMILIFISGQLKHIEWILSIWILIALMTTLESLNIDVYYRLNTLLLFDYIELFAAGICFYQYKNALYGRKTHCLMCILCTSILIRYSWPTSLGLFGFFILFILILRNRAGILRNSALVYLGTLSYALYLIHQNIGYIIINHLSTHALHPLINIGVATGASIGIAHLLVFYIEKPSLLFLRSFYKQKRTLLLSQFKRPK